MVNGLTWKKELKGFTKVYLEPGLFFSGVRPAINVGLSVSRVGGAAQTKAMKKVAGSLRLDMAQFRELQAFAQFGTSELDATTRQQLERGRRLQEVLKQPQYQPMPAEKQIAILFAGANGYLDEWPEEAVADYESQMLEFLESKHSDIFEAISETGEISDETDDMLRKALDDFKGVFQPAA